MISSRTTFGFDACLKKLGWTAESETLGPVKGSRDRFEHPDGIVLVWCGLSNDPPYLGEWILSADAPLGIILWRLAEWYEQFLLDQAFQEL